MTSYLLSFLQAKATQNNFRVFEELDFFDLWIPDSGFRIPDSRVWFSDSGFQVLGLPQNNSVFGMVIEKHGRITTSGVRVFSLKSTNT